MSEEYFLKQIHRHRYFMLLFMLIGLGTGLWLSAHNTKYNSAFSTIYITAQPELDLQNDSRGVISEINLSTTEAFTVQQMYLLSNEMDIAIITRFKLYQHYGIDPNSLYAYDKIIEILHNQLILRANFTIPLFELSFNDPDVDFAVSLVNFTVSKLQEMNKAAVVERLNEKIQLHKLILANVNNESLKISERLGDQIKTFSEIVRSSKFDQHEYENLLSFQNSLVSLTTDLRSINQSLFKVDNIYELAEKSMKDDDFPIVKQIQKAIPRARTPQLSAFAFSSFGMIASIVIYIVFLYFFTRYSREVRIIFKGS